MQRLTRSPRIAWLLMMAALLAILGTSSVAGAEPSNPHPGMAHSSSDAAHGFTDGWFQGQTVQFFYNKPFFCAEPPQSQASSNCIVGAEATRAPRGGDVPVLYVMTPLGFTPPSSTLQCPVAGSCINHPSDLDVSPIFGPGTVIPLPPHSHIVDSRQGGWWEIEVVGVKDLATWNQVVAGKSLATVRSLQSADPSGAHITGDIPSNLFLFFSVR